VITSGNKIWKWAHDQCLGCTACASQPGLWYPVVQNSAEEDKFSFDMKYSFIYSTVFIAHIGLKLGLASIT